MLAPSDARLDAATIRKAVERALEGAVELDARPVRAAVEPGEAPTLRVILRRPAPRAGEAVPSRARVSVRNDAGAEVYSRRGASSSGPARCEPASSTLRTAAALAAGPLPRRGVDPRRPLAPARGRRRASG